MDLVFKRHIHYSWLFLFFSGFFWRAYQYAFVDIYNIKDVIQISPIAFNNHLQISYAYSVYFSFLHSITMTSLILLFEYMYYKYLKRKTELRNDMSKPIHLTEKYIIKNSLSIFLLNFCYIFFYITIQTAINFYFLLNDESLFKQSEEGQRYLYSENKDMDQFDNNYNKYMNYYISATPYLTQLFSHMLITILILYIYCSSSFNNIYDLKTENKLLNIALLQYPYATLGIYMSDFVFTKNNFVNCVLAGSEVFLFAMIGSLLFYVYEFIFYIFKKCYDKCIKHIRINNNNRELQNINSYERYQNHNNL